MFSGAEGAPPNPGFSASIKAFPLSHDLRTVSGEATALVSSEDRYFTRVTAARFYNERLYFNYLATNSLVSASSVSSALARTYFAIPARTVRC